MSSQVLTTVGKGLVTSALTSSSNKYIGWGTGTTAANVADTALTTEQYSTTNDGTHNLRPTGTQSQQTTSVSNDTYQVVATLTVASGTGALAITEAGVFSANGQASNLTTAPSGGSLLSHYVFAALNLNVGDSLQLTAQLQFT